MLTWPRTELGWGWGVKVGGGCYLRQGLNHRVQQGSHPRRHLQELQHCVIERQRRRRFKLSLSGAEPAGAAALARHGEGAKYLGRFAAPS